jgi:hypothetical protein
MNGVPRFGTSETRFHRGKTFQNCTLHPKFVCTHPCDDAGETCQYAIQNKIGIEYTIICIEVRTSVTILDENTSGKPLWI